jgi:phage terminase small subunit
MTKDVTKAARPVWAGGLDDKEMLFVSAYLETLNATKAAVAAGYAKGSANVRGSQLRRRPQVAEAINNALAERMGVTRGRIVEEVSRLAFSNISDVLEIKDGELVVKDHAALDRDTLSTVASIEEHITDKGYRTLRVKQHDRLAALTLLARINGMLINRTELSGPGGGPVEVEHRDHKACVMERLAAMRQRIEPPTIDVTPNRKPAALLAPWLKPEGGLKLTDD